MSTARIQILGAVALILLIVVSVRAFYGNGQITMDLTDAPLSKVLSIIEKQGRVKVVTNADPNTPVTLRVKNSPVVDVLETVATRVDGNLRLAYLAAPDRKKIESALTDFRTNQNSTEWTTFGSPMMGSMLQSDDNSVTDPRIRECSVTLETDKSLQAAFNQFSQKTGILTALPKDWNPVVLKPTLRGQAQDVAPKLVGSARGAVHEVFLLSVWNRRGEGDQRQANERNRPDQPRQIFSPSMNREGLNTEWIAERVQAEISQLPPDQREAAQQQVAEMRNMWESVRNLAPEERRQKMGEMMNSPAMQEQMMDRMASRDARRTPKQRQDRYRRYLDRKEQAKDPAKT